MNLLMNICSSILESSMVMDAAGISSESSVESCSLDHDGDWSYMFMPEPIAGGSENIGTIYNN